MDTEDIWRTPDVLCDGMRRRGPVGWRTRGRRTSSRFTDSSCLLGGSREEVCPVETGDSPF